VVLICISFIARDGEHLTIFKIDNFLFS
jgi:hypothetical protein